MVAPTSLQSLFARYSDFGFSGSRSIPASLVGSSLSASVTFAASCVPIGAAVSVGCAAGVDAVARGLFPSASVFRASDYPAASFAGSLALRSSACVRSVAAASGLWCCFPLLPCPASVVPCASPFSLRSGSGSWASAALAAFSGCSVLVCIPSGALFGCPSWGGSWQFVGCAPSGGGSFFLFVPAPVLSLF